MKCERRLYMCSQCGHKKEHETNHTGAIYPHCARCESQTIWVCLDVEKQPPSQSEMRILIAQDAAERYSADRTLKNGDKMQFSFSWFKMLQALAGEWLTVGTNTLFKNQFNTAPITNEAQKKRIWDRYMSNRTLHGTREDDFKSLVFSNCGHRIMEYCVETVENDARKGKMRCAWCGYSHTLIENNVCNNCGKDEYLEPFTKISSDEFYRARGYNIHGKKV